MKITQRISKALQFALLTGILACSSLSHAQIQYGSSTFNGYSGLINGADIVSASFFVDSSNASFTIHTNGPVNLWQGPSGSGFTQLFFAVNREGNGSDNYCCLPGWTDAQIVYDVPNNTFIWQTAGEHITSDISSHLTVVQDALTLTFPTSLFAMTELIHGETLSWGVSTSVAASSATFEQVAVSGNYRQQSERIWSASPFVYGGPTISIATSIPEPETYAMMLAGLGLMGVAARRRKQKANAA